jgi:acetylglutamate kinase
MKEKLFVIKIGGNVVDDSTTQAAFLNAFAGIAGKKLLVHGGGKIATRIGEQMGIAAQYQDGRRITDAATIDLVTMVYGGLINKQLVVALQAFGCNALGLTGADGNILPAAKRPVIETDYGFVGDMVQEAMQPELLVQLLETGITPVLAPLTHDGHGQLLNTNADTIASAIAIALSAYYTVSLVYCFEKKGVLQDINDEESVVPLITPAIDAAMRREGSLFAGMLPKLDNAFAALTAGVQHVIIGSADDLAVNCSVEKKGTLIQL